MLLKPSDQSINQSVTPKHFAFIYLRCSSSCCVQIRPWPVVPSPDVGPRKSHRTAVPQCQKGRQKAAPSCPFQCIDMEPSKTWLEIPSKKTRHYQAFYGHPLITAQKIQIDNSVWQSKHTNKIQWRLVIAHHNERPIHVKVLTTPFLHRDAENLVQFKQLEHYPPSNVPAKDQRQLQRMKKSSTHKFA